MIKCVSNTKPPLLIVLSGVAGRNKIQLIRLN